MNYTRTALGLLSAQYRSVLKKCFLINLGLFALGAVTAAPASAAIIDDYIGKNITYTGLGSDAAVTSYHYKWVQDANTGIYTLHRLTDTTETPDISTAAQDHRVWDYEEGISIPGYNPPPVLQYYTLDGAVFGGFADVYDSSWNSYSALTLLKGVEDYAEPVIDNILNTTFVGYVSVTDDYYPYYASTFWNATHTVDTIDATFIGNRVDDLYYPFYGSTFGGAIANGFWKIPQGYDATHPEEYVVIKKITGNFIANGAVISNLYNGYGARGITQYPSGRKYTLYYWGGAFGGAIANYYGTIGEIDNAVFANNYVLSTSDTGIEGNVGGAAILNATYRYRSNTQGLWVGLLSQIGNISGTFEGNIAYTEDGNVFGGTIFNLAGYDSSKSTMGNITGTFTKNTSTAKIGGVYGSVIANALFDDDTSIASMGTISGTFSENTATAPQGGISGLIYNDATIAGIENSTFDKNTGEAVYVDGGVIANYGTITNGIKNSTFTDNTFTATGAGSGAAIYTDQDLTIAADNGKTLFKGNKINDVANAVYVDNADLTISATNNGTATFYDIIDGESATVAITGDATGTVQLYNDISNSDVSVEKVNVETGDGEIHNYQLKSLNSDTDSRWKIDLDVNQKTADTFETGTTGLASGGRVTLIDLNLTDYDNVAEESFKVQVLKTQGTATAADLQLALDDDLQKITIDEKTETVDDKVTANTKWSDEFNRNQTTTKKEGQLGLATTNTLNDSIGIDISTTTEKTKTKLGDTLALVNQAQLADKNFTAAKATDKYTATDDLGKTYGNLTIKGVADGAQKSTIDLDGHDGFEVVSGASVTLTDAALTDSKGKSLIDVAEGGKMSLQNADVSNVNLNVDGELAAANNKVAAKKAVFGKGSTLKLDVNNINGDYGAIKADSFDIANGATIDITFGQNPLDGKKTGEVALLSLSDGSDIDNNNFTDNFHNNMYKFERKSEKSGIYGVYQDKTAREISEESGGTENNQNAAGAWVDGPSHPNPKAQGLADDLARLAQTDGAKFNEALTALAPNDDGMAQAALLDLTDRLLLTVDNHLIKSSMEGGLSSGDDLAAVLSDVRSWVKFYYAESKLQRHGDVYGYKADDRGFIAGVDKKVARGTKVGIGMQFDDTDVDAFQRDVNIQTLQGYLYGEYRPSQWFVNGVLSCGVTDYDEDKNVIGHNIGAHYSANIYSIQGLTGYTFKYLTPELGARYYRIKRHGYTDDALQSVSGNDMDLLRTTLGVKAERVYGRFKPHAYAGIMYDVISDRDSAIVSLGNGESYSVDGKSLPRFGVEIGIGSTFAVTDKLAIGAGYEAKFRKKYQDHSGWLDFKYAF